MSKLNLFKPSELKRASEVRKLEKFFFSPGKRSLENTITKAEGLSYTEADIKNCNEIFGDDVISKLTTVRKSRTGSSASKPLTPAYPGHILHLDDKEIGKVGRTYIGVLHAVDSMTKLQYGALLIGTPGLTEFEYKNALQKILNFYRSLHLKQGNADIKVGLIIRTDALSLINQEAFKNALNGSNILLSTGEFGNSHLMQSQTNYSERKTEACLQQAMDSLNYVKESLPVKVPIILEALIYIAVLSVRNLIVRQNENKSPYEKYTNQSFPYDLMDYTPIGTPVVIRAEDTARQATRGARGEFGFLLGPDYDNLPTRQVIKLDSNIINLTTRPPIIFNRRPTLPLPMFSALFPANWPKKKHNTLNRISVREYGISSYINQLNQVQSNTTPIINNVFDGVVNNNTNFDELDKDDIEFNKCVNAVMMCTNFTTQYIGKSGGVIDDSRKIICNTIQTELGLQSKFWSSRLEREAMNEYAEASAEAIIHPMINIATAPMSIKKIHKEAENLGMLDELEIAINTEIKNLEDNNVVEYIPYEDIPDKSKIIRTFMFGVIKRNPDGTVKGLKIRCVANGANQHNSTYSKTASPVISRQLLFMLLHWSCQPGWKRFSFDISAAFCKVEMKDRDLYAELDHHVWKNHPWKRFARLGRVIYGLKQAAREFFLVLRELLCNANFTHNDETMLKFEGSNYDGGIYSMVNSNGEVIALLACHVDDILGVSMAEGIRQQLAEVLMDRFGKITEDDATNFCGLMIEDINDTTIKISQPAYLEQLGSTLNWDEELKDVTNINNWKIMPWDSNSTLEFGLSEIKVSIKKYQTAIGELLYAVQTKPEINPMLAYLSSLQTDPRHDDWQKVLRLMVYLKNTCTEGIIFSAPQLHDATGKPFIHATCDSSIKLNTRYGHTGITVGFGYNNPPFTTVSKRQQLITNSSAEAEMVGFNMASALVVWLRNCLTFIFRVKAEEPTIIEGDCLSAIKAIQKEAITNNLKHVHPKEFYCRMMFQDGILKFGHVNTNELLADTLTKLLDGVKFRIYKARLLNSGGDYGQVNYKRKIDFHISETVIMSIFINKDGEVIKS